MLGEACPGLLQGLRDHQASLHQQVGRVGLAVERTPNHRIGFSNFPCQSDSNKLVEEVLEHARSCGLMSIF
jgi:hypothetical protein